MESASTLAEGPLFAQASSSQRSFFVGGEMESKTETKSSFQDHGQRGILYRCMLVYIAVMSIVILLGAFSSSALSALDRSWAVDTSFSELPPVCGCGSSIPEAIFRGCKFDSLASAWLPEVCRNDELTAKFEQSGPGPNGTWTWFGDRSGEAVLSLEDVAWRAAYDGDYWVTHGYQTMRCFMLWERESEVWTSGSQMENRAFDHIEHCEHDMRSCRPADEIAIHLTTHLRGDKK